MERQLIENFGKLTQRKNIAMKGMDVIEYTKGLVLYIHGIVRMTTDPKIIINGRLEQREEKLKILLRPINVEGWIEYMKKAG